MMKRFCLLLTFVSVVILQSRPLLFAEENLPYQEIGPGIEYVNKWVRDVPWSIHVIKIDRHRSDLNFVTTKALGKVYGLSSILDQMKSLPSNAGHPVAAINGDFFTWQHKPFQGDPRGLQILDGELISAPSGSACFWLDGSKPNIGNVVSKLKVTWPDGTETPVGLNEERGDAAVVISTAALSESTRTTNGMELVLEKDGGDWLPLRAGKTYLARVREVTGTNTAFSPDTLVLSIGPKARVPEVTAGMRVKISTETVPDMSRVELALGGGPLLVHKGKVLPRDPKMADPRKHKEGRNPRTAFGWNKSSYFFVVVDGRRKNVSDGMTFPELAQEMAKLGCTEAINFDGGGSSTIWAGGKVLNEPSDNRLRSVANALICVRRDPDS